VRSAVEGSPLRIGVLASQGGFAAHLEMLGGLGADPVAVRTPEDLADLDGLVIPGGESTTIMKAIVEATTHYEDPERVAAASIGLGAAMSDLEIAPLAERGALLQHRGS